MVNKNSFLKFILIVENLLIISLLLYIIIKNLKDFKEDFIFYFSTLDLFLAKNFIYLIFSILATILVVMSHMILWKKIFQFNNIQISYWEALSIFSFIHFKRLFSPLGPISPILNINQDLKKSTIIYSLYVYFITLGSLCFFSFFVLLIYPWLFLGLVLIIPASFLFFVKKNKLFNIHLSKTDYFFTIFISFLNEFFSFLAYFFSLKLFNSDLNFLNSILIYFAWVIISSFFPFLYGSGTSELGSLILVYNLGYDAGLFSLSIIFYRLIITYFPLLGLIFYKKFYPKNLKDEKRT